MFEFMRKAVLIGAGLASLTREKMENAVNDLVKRGELTEKEGRELINDLIKKSAELKKDLDDRIENTVTRTLNRLNIPTRKEILELKERIEKMEREKESKG
ncbi:MAG: phasin family protein [Syntrophales bacterium]